MYNLMIVSMQQPTKVCLFLRVSTHKQDYERQLTELDEYCRNRGYEIAHKIATVISGRVRYVNRPDVQDLLLMAKSGLFSKVIVTETSRLGRNAADIKFILDTLHSYGVSVVFKNLGIESLDNGVPSFAINIILAVYAELAQEEVRTLSERIKSGLEHAKKKGKQIGRPTGLISPEELLSRYPSMVRDIKKGLSVRKTAAVHGVCQATVMRVKKAMAA
jgi:DNA invertase Pin-like site-specific DNA recombinase